MFDDEVLASLVVSGYAFYVLSLLYLQDKSWVDVILAF
jgi:hypothetical protein